MPPRPNKVARRPVELDLEDPRGDALADVLGVSLLRNALYKRIEARAPWGIRLRTHERAVFYLIARGAGRLEVEGERPLDLSVGDAAFLPHGTGHVLRDALTTPPLDAHDGRRCTEPGPRKLGGSGAPTSILTGFFDLGGRPPSLLASLPRVVALSPNDRATAPWVSATLQLLLAEAAHPGPASMLVLQRLADVLFVQALRSLATTGGTSGHVCRHPGIAALGDDAIREALGLIHQRPGAHWTVASLGTQVGLSRSTFAARFTELVGEPPLEYIARWRMTRAAEFLRDTDLAIDDIAARVGYESVPSFSRAFVRFRGERPGAYRRSARERARLDAEPTPG
ncbi:AraC family transcriptional regulator [Corallococcus macrosporus]|uniref:AraC family transcriptional regulator n=1 Tax=Corallococcus macrosporus DSM 14697 TaxID=1189310 RepID=A0A250JRB3_9BACT|nr:AraC family transcriptional regulator [Corallococcus macrosporus]ATB46022.1 AraC family transcriptional regulator [Corallococcus macrosporus DSM 14697]